MVTIKVDNNTLKLIENDFKDYIIDRNIGYIIFCIKTDEYIITAYDNKNGDIFKVTIQGKDPMPLARKYSLEDKILPKKEKIIKESPYYIDVNPQIGSDEVGTGDLLGPIVVCSAYSDNKTMELIKELKIVDSKKITDKKIMEIVPLLLKKVHFACKILPNKDYNNATKKGFNINAIKAILHNECLLTLHRRCPYVKNVYVDKFVDEKKYYQYLSNKPLVEKDIIFKEKGETYFPSVALASCIARYFFLVEIEKLNKKYNRIIPLGAGKEVNEFSVRFLKDFGEKELLDISKNNFRNIKEILKIKLI